MKTEYTLTISQYPHGGWVRGCVPRGTQGTQGQSPVLTLGPPRVPLGPL